MMEKNLLVIIPARGGSKGVPRKNIKKLGGKPLIQWSIDIFNKSSLTENSRLIISTDDLEIKKIAEECGIEVPYLRPKELSGDHAKTIDCIKHVIDEEHSRGNEYKYVMLLQPTVPFRSVKTLEESYEIFTKLDYEFTSLVSVCRVSSHHPYLMKKVEGGRLKPFFFEEKEGTRRQDYNPPAYMRSGSVYLTTINLVKHDDTIFGSDVFPYEVFNDEIINIDSIYDFYLAEAIASDFI